MLGVLLIFVNFHLSLTMIFPKGIVHYTVNKFDYDVNSQNIITSTMDALQREVCLKFFKNPTDYNATEEAKVLYIHNPDKIQECDFKAIYFTKFIVDMRIGYKCLNTADVARMLSSMIIAGIHLAAPVVNSEDLKKKFEAEERKQATNRGAEPSLLTPSHRNFINHHYLHECSSLAIPVADGRRVEGNEGAMTAENVEYYKNKLWPMGVVMYNIDDNLRKTSLHAMLKQAMSAIELSSCIVFQDIPADDHLVPKSLLYFGLDGEAAPKLGFSEENQTISLWSMTNGAPPGHTAHTLNLLLRALGVSMMSNRHDRDNYVIINWNNVAKGKEHYLERVPSAGWIRNSRLPYDFDSATHAPTNYMCEHCNSGDATVTPAQDHLWQRAVTMGHRTDLSDGDKELLKLLYESQCLQRYSRHR